MSSNAKLTHRERRQRRHHEPCPLCHQSHHYLWTCQCGCAICDFCMQRDLWGFTCNSITWECPDCGKIHSF